MVDHRAPADVTMGRARRCPTDPSTAPSTDVTAPSLRPWQRLAVRLAAAFALLTLLTVGLVGVVIRERHKRELEDTVGTQLLNIARTGALLVDPALHAEVTRTRTSRSDAYVRIREALGAMQQETLLTTPIYTLTDLDPASRRARIMVASDSSAKPGDSLALPAELVEPLGWTFDDGVARYTRVYVTPKGKRITAFAPIVDRMGQATAVLTVDYPVDIYLDRLNELDTTIWRGSLIAAVAALILGLLFARRLTRPISALTGAVGRVAAGDLSQTVPVRSRDEVGQLGRAFNEMVTGLRQRDFIRNAFGRYVSPEVAQTLLESPDGLRLGGHKREITVLMSDLRGYTRFAEMGDPVSVMDVLNDYLGRMADLIIAHGGSINEFIGDAIFAVFGAPLDQPDHAERAAAAALAMQRAMDEFNQALVARGGQRFAMGIGLSTGEAVVGNIGSEQRAKYAVVGAAVNLAGRIEGCTVGGQILLSPATLEHIRDLAEVGPPLQVELKGVAGPVVLHELRGIRGRFAQRLDAADTYAGAPVSLPLRGWVLEGKQLKGDAFTGEVRRLAALHLDAITSAELAPFTNVRLRVRWAGGRESGDLYGKVAGEVDGTVGRLTRITLTSVDPEDQSALEAVVRAGHEPIAPAPVSKPPRP